MVSSHDQLIPTGFRLTEAGPLKNLAIFSRLFAEGAKLGLRSLSPALIRSAGAKRSLGFCIQPIEHWSRYPEMVSVFEFFPTDKANQLVLDLGSPKGISFHLVRAHSGRFVLTDIWDVAVREIAELARRAPLAPNASIELKTADALALSEYQKDSVDVLYSISVLEHIAPQDGLQRALKEFSRVLKTGGNCIVTMPVRPTYEAEYHDTPVYSQTETKAGKTFFSHYYDVAFLQNAIAQASQYGLKLEASRIILWKESWLPLRLWTRVPQKVRGLLGVVNLLIAPWSFRAQDGLPSEKFDAAGDVVLRFSKV
jgi:ubiquinone/menaquinone biosynthesis C-methylase UbiE